MRSETIRVPKLRVPAFKLLLLKLPVVRFSGDGRSGPRRSRRWQGKVGAGSGGLGRSRDFIVSHYR